MFIFTLISIINFMASNHMEKIKIENMENMVKIECLFPSFTFAGFAGFADFAGGKGWSICRLPAAKETTGKAPCIDVSMMTGCIIIQ